MIYIYIYNELYGYLLVWINNYSISTHERYERNADLSWLIHWISMCSPFLFGPINEHEALNVLNWGFIFRHDRGSKHRNGGPIMKVPLSGIDIWFVALFFRVSLLFGMRNSNDEWWIIRWWGFTECIGLKLFFQHKMRCNGECILWIIVMHKTLRMDMLYALGL